MGVGFYNASQQWDEDSFFFCLNGKLDMTKVWILVLLMGGNNSYKNPEVAIIEGFHTKVECLEAGKQIYVMSPTRIKFTCVER